MYNNSNAKVWMFFPNSSSLEKRNGIYLRLDFRSNFQNFLSNVECTIFLSSLPPTSLAS